MRTVTDVLVEYSDHVDVTYVPARVVAPVRGGPGQEYPATLHVHFGGLNFYGRPEEVLRLLCEAVAKAQHAEDTGIDVRDACQDSAGRCSPP
jgi:hypothetical protein